MRLEGLGRQKTFELLFVSHRRAPGENPPTLPDASNYIDIRRYLTAGDIKVQESNFVLHEQSLASVVSLKTPHTIGLDFVALDTEQSKKELKKKIKRIEGSGNTFFGLKSLGEDAKVIREELTELLRQVEKGREKICQARINFIVFG